MFKDDAKVIIQYNVTNTGSHIQHMHKITVYRTYGSIEGLRSWGMMNAWKRNNKEIGLVCTTANNESV